MIGDGLYMSPPCHAVVLSIDEKSQIQALDRTQPGLPLKPGKCATMTDDYKRNGTTTLFAAPNVLDGTVLGRCMKRHRHQEFIKFLNAVERKVPAGKIIHVILDNYGTRKHPKVEAWLADHPRWVFHFTPTSASWLNAVENFFSVITRKRIRRGVFKSVADHILDLLDEGGIVGFLEGAQAVRLKAMSLPDALHSAQADADGLGDSPSGPMRGVSRRFGARQRQHFRHRLCRQGCLARLPRLVAQKAVHPLFGVPPLPAPDRRPAHAAEARNLKYWPSFAGCCDLE